ncbi:TPA_asm: hypothetical protein GZN83_12230, partial [Listeria monocytogenes]|nr:hypothetical protein [Listeria monocytogenes]EJF7858383.1 group II intron reverse transcriptase domain-containing protein [Listeria monocytogenes]HAC3603980.1 hypothetical protein [Listeria monocytogenes]
MKRKLLKSQLRKKNMKDLSSKAIKFYSATGLDNVNYRTYSKREETFIEEIRERVLKNNYKFTRYKEKLILKNRYSYPRCISIPTLKDKLTLKVILETLKEYFPQEARPPLPQECIKAIKMELEKEIYTHFIKLDLSDFYGNITQEILMDKIKVIIKDELLLELIINAIKNPTYPKVKCEKKGIPQGLSISNILAHIYMNEFDSINGDFFLIRYVDDILILCNEENHDRIYKETTGFLTSNLKLILNDKKEEKGLLVEESFNYLGYKLGLNKMGTSMISVKKSNMEKQEKRIINLITKYKYQQEKTGSSYSTKAFIFELNLIITGAVSKKMDEQSDSYKRYGWVFFYSQINCLDRLYHLDRFIDNQIKNLNLPKKEEKKIKKFSKAYREIKFNLKKSKYIFKPDEMSINEKQ